MDRAEFANHHEMLFVETFIVMHRRDRYLKQLSSSKRRPQFLDLLNHRFLHDIDSRFVFDGKPSTYTIRPDDQCYIISDERKFDGLVVSAAKAEAILDSVYFGTIVSYIPGVLAAYKDETPSTLIWLDNFMTLTSS